MLWVWVIKSDLEMLAVKFFSVFKTEWLDLSVSFLVGGLRRNIGRTCCSNTLKSVSTSCSSCFLSSWTFNVKEICWLWNFIIVNVLVFWISLKERIHASFILYPSEFSFLGQSKIAGLRFSYIHSAIRSSSLSISHALLRSIYVESISHHFNLIYFLCVSRTYSARYWPLY